MYTFLDTFCDKLQVIPHQEAIVLKWTKWTLHHTLLCKIKSSHFNGTIPKPQLTSERFIPQRQTALSATFVMWQLETVCHYICTFHTHQLMMRKFRIKWFICSGRWHSALGWVIPSVSEERRTIVLGVKQSKKNDPKDEGSTVLWNVRKYPKTECHVPADLNLEH